MLGGATWPVRLAAVLIVAGAAALGIYVIAWAGDDDAHTKEPKPTTATRTAIVVPSPSPFPSATSIASSPQLDTTGWLTYENETHGFSLRYPPDWTAEDFGSPNSIWLMNPTFETARQAALEANEGRPGGFQPPPESVKFEISVVSAGSVYPFDVLALIRTCNENVTGSERAEEVLVQGRRAVACYWSDATGELTPDIMMQWIELPGGKVLTLAPGTVAASPKEIEQIEAILASLSFEAGSTGSENDTSNWTTYESPLGFTLKYPPDWRVLTIAGSPEGYVRLTNPKAWAEHRRRVEAGIQEGGSQGGEVWIEITPNAFDTLALTIDSCSEGPDTVATTLGGQLSVRCSQEGPSAYDPEHSLRNELVFVELPAGDIVALIAYIVGDVDGDDILAQRAMNTFHIR